MDQTTLERIVRSDIYGLLDTEPVIARWGVYAYIKGRENIWPKSRFYSLEKALASARHAIKNGFQAMIFREIKQNDEWVLTNIEDK